MNAAHGTSERAGGADLLRANQSRQTDHIARNKADP